MATKAWALVLIGCASASPYNASAGYRQLPLSAAASGERLSTSRYQPRLFGLVLMMVRRPAAAEEVTQDAFVRAYTHLDRYDEHRPLYPWLATIAVRLAQNWLRAHQRTSEREGTPLESASEPGEVAGTLERLIGHERSRRIWRAVAALPHVAFGGEPGEAGAPV